jgi:hypothetical protein
MLFRSLAVQNIESRRRVILLIQYQRQRKEIVMNITLSLAPLISLAAGILILVVPRLLNYIVAGYLIVFGLLGLLGVK